MPRFAPVLRYLVEKHGMYVHPSFTKIVDGQPHGLCGGQEVWAEQRYQFLSHSDAAEFAKKCGGQIIKLRVSAKQEAIKH